jgi:hypothetical protein
MSVISGALIILVVMFFKGGIVQLFGNLLMSIQIWRKKKKEYRFGKDE